MLSTSHPTSLLFWESVSKAWVISSALSSCPKIYTLPHVKPPHTPSHSMRLFYLLQPKWISLFFELLKCSFSPMFKIIILNLERALKSNPLHLQNGKLSHGKQKRLCLMSQLVYIRAREESKSPDSDLPYNPPPPQRMPETGMPGDHQGHHLISLKSNSGKRATAFTRIHFILLRIRHLPPMTLDITLLWASPATSVTCCLLFPNSPQFCTSLLRSLAGHGAHRCIY